MSIDSACLSTSVLGKSLFDWLLTLATGTALLSSLADGQDPNVRLAIVGQPVRVGVLAGDTLQEFGGIQAIASRGDGDVYILDSRLNRLNVFSVDGRFIARTGRSGNGPGEFAVPRSMGIDEKGVIHVFDIAGRRISRFRRGSGSIRYEGSNSLRSVGRTMCLMRSEYYMFGAATDSLVSVVSDSGAEVRSFGALFGPPLPRLQRSVSKGEVACYARDGLLVLTPLNLPEVRGYTSAGKLVWSREIPDYSPVLVEAIPNGVRYTSPREGNDQLVSLVPLRDSLALLQVGRITAESARASGYESIVTYVLRTRDGLILGRQKDLPRVLATTHTHLLAATEDPHPHVLFLSYQIQQQGRGSND